MMENEVVSAKLESWHQKKSPELEFVLSSEDLISEEKKPCFFSVCTEDSVCSSSVDLDMVQSENLYPIDNYYGKFKKDSNSILPKKNKSDALSNEISKLESETLVNDSFGSKFRKSNSLHDVSNISPMDLFTKSINGISCETIHSQSLSSTTKSKDSGFQRSLSCISLTSGRPNFDHVESKVRAYIRNIKESEAMRKKNKQLQNIVSIDTQPKVTYDDVILKKEDLLLKIKELQQELQEKALYIDAQQKNYNNLLLKLAEAKNTIDRLRLQGMSLNYNTLYEPGSHPSSNYEKSFGISIFKENINQTSLCDTNKASLQLFKTLCDYKDISSSDEQNLVCLNTSNHSLTESFTPKKHSTPHKSESNKCLSPVSKICSSSSRLDKYYEPLSNPRKDGDCSKCSLSKSIININLPSKCQHSKNKTEKTKQILEKQVNKMVDSYDDRKPKSPHIDLPNDDPFDKVKKWQASLPSVDLLVTYSSSECDLHETNLHNTHNNKKEDNCFSVPQEGEDEKEKIIQSLTQELVTKCRISEKKDYITKEITHKTLFGECLHVNACNKATSEDVKSLLNYSTCGTPCTNTTLSNQNLQNKELLKCQRSSLSNAIIIHDSSLSESDSCSYFPKSSSVSVTLEKIEGDNVDFKDDSSSISSAVLGSNISLISVSENKTSKRKTLLENQSFNKVPKFANNRNFVLKEPTLKVTLPVERTKPAFETSKRKSPNYSENYETWFKYRNSNANTSTTHFKTESSQKKAWKARNNANFYVCKEFYFEKSTSLHDCITIMEGMVKKGSSIIESALDRTD